MAYAKADDLASRWRALTPDEQEVATVLLGDASEILDGLGYSDASSEILRIVACNMVRRAMERHGNAFAPGGVEDASYGWEPTLPAGEMRPYDWEKRLLANGQSAGTVPMADLRYE